VFELLKATFREWREDKAPRLAAALSYYTVFSMAPLLVLVVAVAGLVFGEQAVQGHIVEELEGSVGREAASLLEQAIAGARRPGAGAMATAVGIVLLLLGASGVFGQLQDALNTVWGVAPAPGRGIKRLLVKRLISYAAVLAVGFVLLVSLVASAAVSATGELVAGYYPRLAPTLGLIDFVASLGVITLLFALLLKYLPDARIPWKQVWVGAGFTALLFVIGKSVIGFYLGRTDPGSAYGVAGALVVILLWVYYSSLIFLFGAEFTQVQARRVGTPSRPAPGAVSLATPPRSEDVRLVEPPRIPVVIAFLLGWLIGRSKGGS
jgi:membrane protein